MRCGKQAPASGSGLIVLPALSQAGERPTGSPRPRPADRHHRDTAAAPSPGSPSRASPLGRGTLVERHRKPWSSAEGAGHRNAGRRRSMGCWQAQADKLRACSAPPAPISKSTSRWAWPARRPRCRFVPGLEAWADHPRRTSPSRLSPSLSEDVSRQRWLKRWRERCVASLPGMRQTLREAQSRPDRTSAENPAIANGMSSLAPTIRPPVTALTRNPWATTRTRSSI